MVTKGNMFVSSSTPPHVETLSSDHEFFVKERLSSEDELPVEKQSRAKEAPTIVVGQRVGCEFFVRHNSTWSGLQGYLDVYSCSLQAYPILQPTPGLCGLMHADAGVSLNFRIGKLAANCRAVPITLTTYFDELNRGLKVRSFMKSMFTMVTLIECRNMLCNTSRKIRRRNQ